MNSSEISEILRLRKPKRLLAIPFEDASLVEFLGNAVPDLYIQVLHKRDLAGISFSRMIGKLRALPSDVAVCSLHESTVNRSRSSTELLLGVVRANKRYLRIGEDEFVEVNSSNFVVRVLPRLFAGLLLGFVSAAALYALCVLSRLYPALTRKHTVPQQGTVLFLRTDLAGRLTAGGSVSHVKGMVGAFESMGYRTVYIGDSRVDELPPSVHQEIVLPMRIVDVFDEFQLVVYNFQLLVRTLKWIQLYKPVMVYQRHGVLNIAGGLIAKKAGIPFVLEANASEVWAKLHWSRLLMKNLAIRCESTALRMADRVAVISTGVREQLVPYKLPEAKILLNPNGVDPMEFDPTIDGARVRSRYTAGTDIVVGFIGTFTKWHGVEILFQAAEIVLQRTKEIVFLLIGDGELRSTLQERAELRGLAQRMNFTGLIPHSEASGYLAACDILVSPHLGFEGTEKFFGSPTKLFEYMAMGKAIVASNLEQIGEIIEDGKTGLHCRPGDPDDLVEKILMLATDKNLRENLGTNARAEVEKNYTWAKNVEKIIRSFSSFD